MPIARRDLALTALVVLVCGPSAFAGKKGRGGATADAPEPAAQDTTPKHWFYPTFKLDGKDHRAGTAFLVDADGARFVLTAHHLFGPAGGLRADLTGDELVKRVSGVHGETGGVTITGGRPLLFPDAAPASNTLQFSLDLAAFPVEQDGGAPTLTLAPGLPQIGDRVYLASTPPRAPKIGDHAPATITDVNSEFITYRFVDTFEQTATSGGPVVDEEGRLVAIHVGGDKDGSVGVSATAVGRRLGWVRSGRSQTEPDLFGGPALGSIPGATRVPVKAALDIHGLGTGPLLSGCVAYELPGIDPDSGFHGHSLVCGAHQLTLSSLDSAKQFSTPDAMREASMESAAQYGKTYTRQDAALKLADGSMTPVNWALVDGVPWLAAAGHKGPSQTTGLLCVGQEAVASRELFCGRAFADLMQ